MVYVIHLTKTIIMLVTIDIRYWSITPLNILFSLLLQLVRDSMTQGHEVMSQKREDKKIFGTLIHLSYSYVLFFMILTK